MVEVVKGHFGRLGQLGEREPRLLFYFVIAHAAICYGIGKVDEVNISTVSTGPLGIIVDAKKLERVDFPAGLFPYFALGCLDSGFVAVHVAARQAPFAALDEALVAPGEKGLTVLDDKARYSDMPKLGCVSLFKCAMYHISMIANIPYESDGAL